MAVARAMSSSKAEGKYLIVHVLTETVSRMLPGHSHILRTELVTVS